jgi:hypothetical protein
MILLSSANIVDIFLSLHILQLKKNAACPFGSPPFFPVRVHVVLLVTHEYVAWYVFLQEFIARARLKY